MDSIITEAQVIFTAKNGGVEYLRAKVIEGDFALYAKLKEFKEEQPIFTQRKEPKIWVSLDRLAKHVSKYYGVTPPTLIVDLRSFSDEKS